jgi:hypothetical protein
VDDVVAADPVLGRPYEARFIGSTDDVVFFVTEVRSRAFTGMTWREQDVVAFAATGRLKRLGPVTWREFALQGGLDANERVRVAAARLRPQWPER